MAIGFRPRRKLTNPLILRARRHAGLSVLFRSPQAVSSPVESMPGEYVSLSARSSRVPLVGASLMPARDREVIPAPPALTELPELPPRQQEQAAVAPQTPSYPAAPIPAPVQRTSTFPATQDRSPLPSALPEPAAPVQTASAGEEDRIWRRLQNIFRKHEEKRQAEEQSKQTPVSDAEASPETAEEAAPMPIQPSEEPSVSKAPPAQQPSQAEAAPSPSSSQPSSAATPPAGRRGIPTIREVEASDRKAPGSVPAQPATGLQRRPALRAEEVSKPASIPPAAVEMTPAEKPDNLLAPAGKESASPLPASPAAAPSAEQIAAPAEIEQPAVQTSEALKPPQVASKVPAEPPITAPSEPLSPAATRVSLKPQVDRQEARTAPAPAQPGERQPEEETLIAPASEQTTRFSGAPQPPIRQAAPLPIETAARQLQPVPLEEAWPVERLAAAPEEKPQPQQVLPPPSASLAASPEVQQISGLLREVAPGQPTDSLVEVVTPRRPRPAVLQAKPATVQGPPPPAEEGSVPVQEDQTVPSEPMATVPTEIGPLPADLWHLIGQEPPESAPRAPIPAAPAQPGLQRQPETGVQPAVAQPASKPSRTTEETHPDARVLAVYPADLLASEEAQDVVQRAPDEEPPAESPPEAPAPGGPAAAEINLDELTRKVYQEVKRRLASEWERMRRKF